MPTTLRPAPPRLAPLVPGLALAGVATALCLVVSSWLPAVSPLLVAVLLGALLANVVPLPAAARPGLAVASRRLLRVGIVLLGLQVALGDVLGLGAGMLATIVAVVAVGFATAELLGRRLGLPPDQRLLIGGGFSICGAAAVAAVDGVLDADEEQTATALALVVLFGTGMIPLVPVLASVAGLDPQLAGRWAGASIHEVAQVVAAAGVIGPGALADAVLVKLGRVCLLAPVMAVLAVVARRRAAGDASGRRLPPLLPLFVVGFVAMVVLRSLLTLPPVVLADAALLQKILLTAAMFALGTGVHAGLVRRVGAAPLLLALATTVAVAATAFAGVVLSS